MLASEANAFQFTFLLAITVPVLKEACVSCDTVGGACDPARVLHQL